MPTPPSSQPRKQSDAPDTKLPKDDAALTRSVSPSESVTMAANPSNTAAAPLALQAGSRPVPDYELIQQLGVGGFGEVWKARGPGGFEVALKFVRLSERGSESELRALEIMKSIRHPNLVGVFGVWPKDGWLIVAMELCDCSLHDRLQEARKRDLPGVPIKELLKYMQQAAEGLDALNARGVQHRDVKPRNLMVVGNGVKATDFGLAKVLEQSHAVHSGSMTLSYAAPEAFKGSLAAQSDQYSLAITYYELRTGVLPFSGDPMRLMYAHLELAPDLSPLPPEERPVLARALAKEPKERWKNCKTFVNELIKAHQGRKTEALKKTETLKPPPLPKPADDIFQQKTVLTPGLRKQQMPDKIGWLLSLSRRNRWLWPVLAGLLLVVLLSCGVVGALSLGMGLFANRKGTNKDGTTLPPLPVTQTEEKEPDEKKPDEKKPPDPPPSLPKTLTVDLGNGVTMEFVLIPKGKFQMGSPATEPERNPWEKDFDAEKQHEVEISKPFYLAKYPVTQAQYQQVMGKNPNHFKDDSGRLPVEDGSWDDTQDFCREMMKKYREQIPTALRQPQYRFALPTEAQWEYACRAGTTTPFYFGSQLNGKEANCNGNFPYGTNDKGPYKERTTKVGEYGENPWGLCDMHGNVLQWCADYYGPYNNDLKTTDPLRSLKYSEERRVLRGGSWVDHAESCRAAYRSGCAPDLLRGAINIGFRVCVRPEDERPEDKKPDPPPPLPKTLTVDLGDGVKMEFVLIPKGKFQMGSPATEPERNPLEKNFDSERQHEVEISKPFYLAKYPVTQKQYQTLVKKNPSCFQAGKAGADKVQGLDTDDLPVESVTWDEAQAFCKKMRALDKQGRPFRLPTEAEWEYACRAGTTTPFYFGSKLNGKEANCNGNFTYGTTDRGPYKERTTKVEDYGANPWDLYDMHGNVYQWCADYYGPYNGDLKATDPLRSVKHTEEQRVLRGGGSWGNGATVSRAACRSGAAPDVRGDNVGFRVAFRPD